MLTINQQRYFKTLFDDFTDLIEIRLIKDGHAKQLFMTYDDLFNYKVPKDTNVYVGIFERDKRKGDRNSCIKTNVLYLDFDNTELETIIQQINKYKIPYPTMIVNSGHGYHLYWLLDHSASHEVEPVLKALQERLNADSRVVDIARVLRVPDTMNVKDKPVKSTLVECNDNRTSLQTFESILNVKAEVNDSIRHDGIVKELSEIKFNGLNNMAHGVDKGERNFCTGRIVQTLRRLNYTKQETVQIVLRWNKLNKPSKNIKEMKHDISVFWYEYTDMNRYRYDGKEFTDDRLQELNSRFIADDTTFFKGDENSTHNYDNELLKKEIFEKISGLTFAVLSIIKLAESKGIRREHIADLCKRNKNDNNLRKSLQLLENLHHIKIIKKNRINYYVFTEKANYKRGYTAVSKSLHRSFIYGELKEHEYKMMILLENFAFDNKKELFPSNNILAYRLGRTDRNVRQILKHLVHKQFIVIEFKKGKRYIRLIYR